jgi:hypothetical protein
MGMRLHNRQIKAAFWTDEEITTWPLEKRLFYLGLINLADDSGCLEDSPRMIRRLLFPEEMMIEEVAGYIESLVSDSKVIRYTSENKLCLYLKNFHKHQSIDNPSKPEVPLPIWITFQPYKSKDSQGTYTILYDVLTNYLNGSSESLTNPLPVPSESLTNPLPVPSESLTSPYQPEPEHEPEHEPEPIIRTESESTLSASDNPPIEFSEFQEKQTEREQKGTQVGLSPPLREALRLFSATRFRTRGLREQHEKLLEDFGEELYLKAITWASAKMGLGDVDKMRSAAETMKNGTGKPKQEARPNGHNSGTARQPQRIPTAQTSGKPRVYESFAEFNAAHPAPNRSG